ncbi:hypothetical protein RRG08_030963 [Elysia crispata]|uniref:Uncharacterized protein n=1 Tax=Elysia crispata TaxID=231223 RepID=A0AAE0ZTJ5_9GAST|nr:hypothetical protein RRG08_030963 [Elysia crispata]
MSTSSSDYVILSVADNGLREIRLLLLETSLAYQRSSQGRISLSRDSDASRLVEPAQRFGLTEDCAVKTTKSELRVRRFEDSFFRSPSVRLKYLKQT